MIQSPRPTSGQCCAADQDFNMGLWGTVHIQAVWWPYSPSVPGTDLSTERTPRCSDTWPSVLRMSPAGSQEVPRQCSPREWPSACSAAGAGGARREPAQSADRPCPHRQAEALGSRSVWPTGLQELASSCASPTGRQTRVLETAEQSPLPSLMTIRPSRPWRGDSGWFLVPSLQG